MFKTIQKGDIKLIAFLGLGKTTYYWSYKMVKARYLMIFWNFVVDTIDLNISLFTTHGSICIFHNEFIASWLFVK